ncbi:MAG: hypothetical protein ACD_10C00681G0003 [uncultured bacterium]|nr:MAG: hypothetical protein ACD_10C00681G0003 [uncultured bacterium]
MHNKTWLFVYGSLLNPQSAARVLGRPVESYTPYCLKQASLRWSSPQKVRLLNDNSVFVASSLNIDLNAAADRCAQGALLTVSTSEIANLLIRENGYSLINIEERIAAEYPGRAYVFADLRSNARETVVMQAYLERVLEGASSQGESFETAYRRGLPVPKHIIEGNFEFFDAAHQRLV